MSMDCEGTVEIPMEEFWEFVAKYNSLQSCEIQYGVPRCNKESSRMEIDFAASTECHPMEWSKKPKAVLQWELEKKT
jgi:hypothetical protein